MNEMTDLSWTQTSRAMTSLPLDRASNNYKPWWQTVREYNNETKRLKRVRVTECKDDSVFTSL